MGGNWKGHHGPERRNKKILRMKPARLSRPTHCRPKNTLLSWSLLQLPAGKVVSMSTSHPFQLNLEEALGPVSYTTIGGAR